MIKVNKLDMSVPDVLSDESLLSVKKEICAEKKALPTINIITIDFGSNGVTYYCSEWENLTTKKTKKENIFNDIKNLFKKYSNIKFVIVVEDSHMGKDRCAKSLSQPFLASELQEFYEYCENLGHSIKLFPQMKTPKAIALTKSKKCDKEDPIAIYKYIIKNPHEIQSYKNPPKYFDVENKRLESWDYKNNMNETLNAARRYSYGQPKVEDRNDFGEDQLSSWVIKNLHTITNNVSQETREIFGLIKKNTYARDMKRYNAKKGDYKLGQISMNALCAIASALFDGEPIINEETKKFSLTIKPRLRSKTNDLVGWKYASRYLLGFTPHHLKGGVARSNLKFHHFRSYVASYCEKNNNSIKRVPEGKKRSQFITWKDYSDSQLKLFKQAQKNHTKACREVFNVMKSILSETI